MVCRIYLNDQLKIEKSGLIKKGTFFSRYVGISFSCKF